MLIPDPAVVKRLRDRARAVVDAHPPLAAERKRVRVPRASRPSLVRAAVGVLGPALLVGGLMASGASAEAGDVFLLWVFAHTLLRAQQTVTMATEPGELFMPYTLPVSDDTVFAAQRRIVRSNARWLALDCASFATLLLIWKPLSPAAGVALPLFLVAQWAASFAMAGLLALWRKALAIVWTAAAAGFLVLLGFLFAQKIGALLPQLRPVLQVLRWGTPVGWVQTAFDQAVLQASWLGVAALALTAAGAWVALPAIERRLRQRFDLDAVFHEFPPDFRSGTEADDIAENAPASEAQRQHFPDAPHADVATVAARLRQELDQPAGLALFERGHPDRLLVRLISERRRILLDFLRPGGAPWKHGVVLSLALVVLARIILLLSSPEMLIVAGGVGVALLVLWLLPIFGGSWSGLGSFQAERAQVAWLALHPLGFWPVVWTVLAHNALRMLATLPLFVLPVMFCFTPAPLSLATTLDFCVRGFVAVAALQPFFVLLQLGQCAAGSRLPWGLALLGLVLLVLAALVAFFLVAAGFGLETGAGLACLAAVGALNFAFLAAFGFAWNRSWFDLAKMPPR